MPQRSDHFVDRLASWISAPVTFLGSIAILLLSFHVVIDVFSRYVFNEPLTGTIEYVQFWYMVPIAFLGAAQAQRLREHIDVPVLYDVLPRTARLELSVFSDLTVLVFAGLLVWYGFEEAFLQMGRGERDGAVGILVWPTRFFVPLGALALASQSLADLLTTLREGPANEEDLLVDPISQVE